VCMSMFAQFGNKVKSWTLVLVLASCGSPQDEVLRSNLEAPLKANTSLRYLGGEVLTTPKIAAIFWGPEWENDLDFQSRKTKMVTLLQGLDNSQYLKVLGEYADASGSVSSRLPLTEVSIDSSLPPQRTLQTYEGIAKVCSITKNNPDSSTIYMLYTTTTLSRGDGRCAWHYWGNCGNKKVVIAYIPNLDGRGNCNPKDSVSGNNVGTAAIANTSVHEIVESITDPRGRGWKDSKNQEVADKCAWTWPKGSLTTLSNGSRWKLQNIWSNKAYIGNLGEPNSRGEKGCVTR